MRGRQTLKLWVPDGHFNQSIYAFISLINGGSVEDFSCANIWNMLETTALLDTDIQEKFSVKNPFLPTFFFSDSQVCISVNTLKEHLTDT